MKIGFDAKRAFYNTRGLGNYSRDTIRILSDKKPDNEYFLFTPKTANKIEFPFSSNNCRIIEPSAFLYKKFSSLWRTRFECTDIKRLKLDIFHGLSHELPIGIEKTKAHSVVTMHDIIFLTFPHLYTWIDRQLYIKKYLSSCWAADKIIAISEQTKADLIEFTNISEEKITVVYQGCNPVFLQKIGKEKIIQTKKKYNLPEHYLLNVGAIERRKNQELIIKALATQKVDIPLVIVGKPTEYIKELKKIIIENSLEAKVQFLSNVPNEDLPAIYCGAEIFVYPSLFEGFGIPILEALNSNIPVITSSGSCFKETGGEGSIYINHNSVDELVESIQLILENPKKKEQMIKIGLQHAQLFSDEQIAENLFSVYQSIS